MSLDVSLMRVQPCEVYTANITHNLTGMAEEAGIYTHLWRPEEIGITHAYQLIEPLKAALKQLRGDPERFDKHNPNNGWGNYHVFVQFLERYLAACEDKPDCTINISR